jgi:arylsulfatase A-like enzyme
MILAALVWRRFAVSFLFMFVGLVLSSVAGGASEVHDSVGGESPSAPLSKSRRHLLVVLVDDMPPLSAFTELTGFQEDSHPGTSATSALYADTPVLDDLVASGVRFNCFRTCPLCSPSRACLLTGRYPFRHGVGTQLILDHDGPVGQGGLAEYGDAEFAAPSIVQALAQAGVRTGIVGKLHLSTWTTEEFSKNPGRMGSGWAILPRLAAPSTFLATQLRNLNQIPVPNSNDSDDGGYYNYFSNDSAQNSDIVVQSEYVTSWQVDRAIDFFQSVSPSQQSFCLLALNACHSPFGKRGNPPDMWRDFPPPSLYSTQEYADLIQTATEEGVETSWPQYMASLEAVDAELGRLLASIPSKVRSKLSILFLGDNGVEAAMYDARWQWNKDFGPEWNSFFAAHGEQRLKGSVYHWGSSTCALWSGPGWDSDELPTAGTSTWAMIDFVDIAKTMADYFGVGFAPGDGISFLPVVYEGVGPRQHLRQQTLSEVFWPCGDWHSIETGDAPAEKLTRGFHRWLNGTDYPNGIGGRFSLIRAFTGGVWRDELYLLNAEDGSPNDILENEDLLLLGGFEQQYAAMGAELEKLLESSV